MEPAIEYHDLLRLVDTRMAGPDFPDLLDLRAPRADRLAELGLAGATSDELAEVVALRDALVPVVLGQEEALACHALNGLVVAYGMVPELVDPRTVRLRSARKGRAARLAEEVVAQAFRLVLNGDRGRVRICAATDCAAPFVTQPSPRPRQFCSNRCSTRVRVRRHRATTPPHAAATRGQQ